MSKGQSNRDIKYSCTKCHQEFPNGDQLFAKRVEFTTIGKVFKRLRSRTVAWLCESCRNADPAWQQEKWSDTPGHADVKKKEEVVIHASGQ